MSPSEQRIYEDGVRHRQANKSKLLNPHAYMTKLWAWWCAGWNDQDLGARK